MFVYNVQYIIGAYDGTIDHGIADTLDKAVEYCQSRIKKGDSHVDNPIKKRRGFVITEYELNRFVNTLVDSSHHRFFNDEGKAI